MKHYLVDTNVVIDMLLNREDADAACAVFDGAERGEYMLHICALSFVIDMALKSGWKDFEDAVQNFSAVADPQITAIITRNTKDFADSTLDIIDSVSFL